jgi:hypothetical protein
MLKTKLITTIICVLIFQGCATIPPKKVHYWPGEARLYTPSIRDELFPEQKYLDLKKGERQKLGLALSGGGVRSASFSIGALSGLQKANILKHVDVISTVSGGGYAGYWFMNSLLALENSNDIKLFNRDALFADCFHSEIYDGYGSESSTLSVCKKGKKDKNIYRSNDYRFQNHLAERTDLLYYTQNNALQYVELGGKLFVAQVPSILSNQVANSLFDWGANVSRWRKYYQNGIERTYGLIPINIEPDSYSDRQYYNAHSSLGLRNAKTEEYDFQHLQDYVKKRWKECTIDSRDKGKCNRPPLWIINTTAGVANRLYEFQESTQPLNKTVFSITPFGYGTSEYGFVDEPMDQFSVSKAVSISGAAMDSQVKGSKKNSELLFVADQLLCTNLGYSIDNYNPERSKIGRHKLMPWPFYYLHGFTRNKDSVDIYLSDGGHSENLGAYPLIIRGIPQIIIIDAEYDNDGKFEALTELKSALEKEEKLYLSFYDYNPNCKQDKCIQSEEEFNNKLKNHDPHVKQSVLYFKVKGFQQGYISDKDKKNFVEIIYVKSSLNPSSKFMDKNNCNKKNDVYPCTVVAYYQHEQDILKEKTIFSRIEHDNTFPQHKTFAGEIKSSPAYYYAYRDLASYIIRHNMRWEKGKLMMIDNK